MRARWPTLSWSRELIGKAFLAGNDSTRSADGERADENLHAGVTAQTEARSANLQQTGAAGPQHAESTARTYAEFSHAADPPRLAGDLCDVGPIAGIK